MNKLKKLSLKELEKAVAVIEDQRWIVGGVSGISDIGGGSQIISWSGSSNDYGSMTNLFFGDSFSQSWMNTPSMYNENSTTPISSSNSTASSSSSGATNVTEVNIKGGSLVSYDNSGKGDDYTVYQGNDGTLLVFDGVTAKNDYAPDGSAYQLNGTVHVGAGPTACFDVGTMVHEYGHYLQEESWGTVPYVVAAGAGSLYGRLDQDTDYYQIPTEAGANKRGQAYIDEYYPYSDITPPTK